jgi:hypothetical protein
MTEKVTELPKETTKMRELKGDDIFTMLGILGKLDCQEEIMALVDGAFNSAEKDLEKRGTKVVAGLVFAVMKNINKAKDDINSFLADLTGKEVSEINSLSMIDYAKLLTAFFKKEELKDFFKSIASVLS